MGGNAQRRRQTYADGRQSQLITHYANGTDAMNLKNTIKQIQNDLFNSESKSSNDIGHAMESTALAFLQQQGLKLVERNYRCKAGEIDLIMEAKEWLIFVEVRFRKQRGYGSAAETVDNRKQQKLKRAAEHYLLSSRYQGPCRFDVIAMHEHHTNKVDIDWLPNAF